MKSFLQPIPSTAVPAALLLLVAAAVLLLTPARAGATPFLPPEGERFVYQWELKKLGALLGGILLPGQGKGLLTVRPQEDGRLLTELLITSPQSDEGEFYRYGSEIDGQDFRTLRAWTSYLWRGEKKSKSAEIEEEGVIDVASGIHTIRRLQPTTPTKMRIWSEGKIYPVLVSYMGKETRKLPGGRELPARHYLIRGRDVPGEREWKGHMDLWIAEDGEATPIEIHFDRTLLGVRLELVDDRGGAADPV